MWTVEKDGIQTLSTKLLECVEEVLVCDIHEKLQHAAADMQIPTSGEIKELSGAGARWAATMTGRMHEKLDENFWLAMDAKLNGKMSECDLPEVSIGLLYHGEFCMIICAG